MRLKGLICGLLVGLMFVPAANAQRPICINGQCQLPIPTTNKTVATTDQAISAPVIEYQEVLPIRNDSAFAAAGRSFR